MSATTDKGADAPTFYTVREAARIMRIAPATLYRAIREDAFPAIRVRTRYVVPARAVEEMARRAVDSGGVVDVVGMAAERRTAREVARRIGGASW